MNQQILVLQNICVWLSELILDKLMLLTYTIAWSSHFKMKMIHTKETFLSTLKNVSAIRLFCVRHMLVRNFHVNQIWFEIFSIIFIPVVNASNLLNSFKVSQMSCHIKCCIQDASLFFSLIQPQKAKLLAFDAILQELKSPYKSYLEFLDFILLMFNVLNKPMQSEQPKIHNLKDSVVSLLRTITDCYVKPEHAQKAGR
ncbi:hypothetical protein PR048_029391 [Dryococelus australis]|uniref:Uncharacterized protein n=1 Tax=Dryococelus australis TaxID=614101 RepID=A0ABQ9GD85_9NEOP|nr:hypothetical protein PR048_029391 [Dryococelus australis]